MARRRLGRVEHDDRGNARMEWALMPEKEAGKRVVLELLDEPGADGGANPGRVAHGFQPYSDGTAILNPESTPPRKPKDLRKLGEWIKLTREMEARRKREDQG